MPATGLRIGELSRRTGVNPAVLRAWERRYGVPAPAPLAPAGSAATRRPTRRACA